MSDYTPEQMRAMAHEVTVDYKTTKAETDPIAAMLHQGADAIKALAAKEQEIARLTVACGGGRSFGTLWEAAEEFLFPSLGPDCFDKLITASAKQYLRDRWIAWKGLDELEAQP